LSNCRSHRAKLISATFVALTLLAAQAAAAPTAEQAKEAGRRVGANTSNAVRSSAMDEETVQKLQGGGLYAKGSVNSSNGYSGSVTTTLKLSCGDGEAQSTRTGTRVATSYCSGSSAIISLCRSAIEEGRPCESADWFDTPGIGSGSSYSDADFTIEIGDCSGTLQAARALQKLPSRRRKQPTPTTLRPSATPEPPPPLRIPSMPETSP